MPYEPLRRNTTFTNRLIKLLHLSASDCSLRNPWNIICNTNITHITNIIHLIPYSHVCTTNLRTGGSLLTSSARKFADRFDVHARVRRCNVSQAPNAISIPESFKGSAPGETRGSRDIDSNDWQNHFIPRRAGDRDRAVAAVRLRPAGFPRVVKYRRTPRE